MEARAANQTRRTGELMRDSRRSFLRSHLHRLSFIAACCYILYFLLRMVSLNIFVFSANTTAKVKIKRSVSSSRKIEARVATVIESESIGSANIGKI